MSKLLVLTMQMILHKTLAENVLFSHLYSDSNLKKVIFLVYHFSVIGIGTLVATTDIQHVIFCAAGITFRGFSF